MSWCVPSSARAVVLTCIAQGPSTEELTFRSTILCVCLLARLSPAFLVFGTPLWFGVAHLHHALEVYRSGGSTKAAAMRALLGCREYRHSSSHLSSKSTLIMTSQFQVYLPITPSFHHRSLGLSLLMP